MGSVEVTDGRWEAVGLFIISGIMVLEKVASDLSLNLTGVPDLLLSAI